MKAKCKNARNYRIAIVLLILLIIASISFFDYTNKSNQQSNESVHDMASKVNENISLTIYNKLKDVEMILTAHALQASQYDNIKDPIVMNVFHAQSIDNNFLNISIATADGQKTSANTLEVVDCSQEEDFQAAMRGEYYISKDIKKDINGKPSILYSVPIQKGDNIVGVLQSTVDLDMFSDILKLSCTENGQEAVLIENNGLILSKTWDIPNTNLLTYLKSADLKDHQKIADLKQNIAERKVGNVHFFIDDKDTLAYYSSVKGNNDWVIVTLFPYQLISTQITSQYKQTTQFTLKLVALLLIALIIITYFERRATKELKSINTQLDTVIDNTTGCLIVYEYHKPQNLRFLNDEFVNISGYSKEEFKEIFHNDLTNVIHPDDLEMLQHRIYEDAINRDIQHSLSYSYRMIHKNGSSIWVMDRRRLIKDSSNSVWFYVTLMDITELKSVQEKLRISQKRYAMIIEQTESVVFEWDVQHDIITFSDLWKKKFGYECEYDDFLTKVSCLFQQEEASFVPLLERFIKGDMQGQIECKIPKIDDGYIWCKINARAIKDSFGYLLTVFGSIEDIDVIKSKTLILEEKSRIDGLTNVYNKITTQELICDAITQYPDKSHVVFIIDVDDFKNVNDTMGHAVGDHVLTQIGLRISSCFRGDDLVGRIGGDEFIAFMKNINQHDVPMLTQKIDCLHKLLSTIEVNQGNSITCSIGVAIYPKDGTTFEELYKSADDALYYAKRSGKDSWHMKSDMKD